MIIVSHSEKNKYLRPTIYKAYMHTKEMNNNTFSFDIDLKYNKKF